MKVVVIGGTGFLGHFVVTELVKRGHRVTAIGHPPAPPAGYLPDGAEVILANIHEMPDATLVKIVQGADAVVFGGGADGRDLFVSPAIYHYRNANVAPIRRLIPLLKQSDVARLLILGSYYTALDRTFPALKLGETHPYVQSRLEQNAIAFDLAGKNMAVGILELPYIFGAAPGRGTLWGFYLQHILNHEIVPVPAGGTAVVTAKQVGIATASGCEKLEGHRHFSVVDSNWSYKNLYAQFAEALGARRTYQELSREEAIEQAKIQDQKLTAAGTEHGMHPIGLAIAQSLPLHLDPAPAMETLGFGVHNLPQAIDETVKATLRFDM